MLRVLRLPAPAQVTQLRRPEQLFFRYRAVPFVDVPALLQGEAKAATYEQLCVVSPLTGRELPITPDERAFIERVPLDAGLDDASLDEHDASLARRLVGDGVLVPDDDERLTRIPWHEYSALAHALWRWRGVDAAPDLEPAAAGEFLERFGPPPPHFVPHREGAPAVELPLAEPDERIASLLRARRTTREFDQSAPLPLRSFALLLRWVWGCHGTFTVAPDAVLLKKTSPSGGGLHPVEVYPLVLRVEDVEPGLYRYRPDDHALELRERIATDEGRALATLFTAGQVYLAQADVLFLLTARFDRAFWKYRNHPRAYGVLLMDAAHLSQTFQVLCAELGLGAFVTAAINGGDIDDRLGLEPFEESALAICGCGTPAREPRGLDPEFEPYVPR